VRAEHLAAAHLERRLRARDAHAGRALERLLDEVVPVAVDEEDLEPGARQPAQPLDRVAVVRALEMARPDPVVEEIPEEDEAVEGRPLGIDDGEKPAGRGGVPRSEMNVAGKQGSR